MHVILALTPMTHLLPSQCFAVELLAPSVSSPSLVTQRRNSRLSHISVVVLSPRIHTNPPRRRAPSSLLLATSSSSLRHLTLKALSMSPRTSMILPRLSDGRNLG